MSIESIMTTSVATIRPDDLLGTAAQVMLWSGGRHLPVLEDGRLVGILSEGDLFRARSKVVGDQRMKVRDAMTSPVKTAAPGDSVSAAAGRMAADKFACLPVVENGKLIGIVTTTDVMTALEDEELSRKQSAFQDELGVEVLSFRTLRDRIRLKAHLGGMDLREAFHELQGDIAEAERLIATAAGGATSFIRKVRERAEKMFGAPKKRAVKSSDRPSRAASKAKPRGGQAAHK